MSRHGPKITSLILLITIGRPRAAVWLSAVQQRILRLAALGCDDAQIARILGRKAAGIGRHKARATKRLGVSGRRSIARWAIRQGLTHAGDQLSPSERRALALPEPARQANAAGSS